MGKVGFWISRFSGFRDWSESGNRGFMDFRILRFRDFVILLVCRFMVVFVLQALCFVGSLSFGISRAVGLLVWGFGVIAGFPALSVSWF